MLLLLKTGFQNWSDSETTGVKIFTLLLLSGTILLFVFRTLIGGYLKLIIYISLYSIRREPSVYILWGMSDDCNQ